ncbi:MAG: EF-P lysine aminoacylase GenX [Candidatus Magasanikbacteria bacterium RIFCSPHIGHO2_01_FULL_47_8]|uniref:EF-P lysine aminoacylase GenX n=1 Tax=Candidatus Magasanikbacteria bacterium RIFCSPHIGHO2_01_FULL_47_8 TaxID=1798673 RepID=A0A1F6MB45_9BACT|nr:MAG: EF-P lysine aminoacylase GenX [Candidatus Magasanikbacteria bacterium RIFCSPHIGHO2_01_FULL_47_8]
MSTWSDLKNNHRLKEIYEQRIKIVKSIREFFWSNNFVETETPVAVRYASQEPYLNPIPAAIHDTRSTIYKMYLRTSPEYALKKLLAAGFEKIFEIGKCFRDFESFGGNHNTEFTMLEWYRAPGTYQEIMDDTEKLFKYVSESLKIEDLRFKDYKIKVNQTWDRMTMKEVWQKYVGVNLDEYLKIERLKDLVSERGYQVETEDMYEDLFFKLFLNEIEPKLGLERPIFVYNYPAEMSSLSRLCDHDSRYAERFELYIGGLEVANAFGELTDADEQLHRLTKDQELRSKLRKEIWPVDPDFIAALRSGIGSAGLPADLSAEALAKVGALAKAGGIALGVDRMILLFTGAKDINEVMFNSVNDQLTTNN